MTVYTELDTPVGGLLVEGGPEGLTAITFLEGDGATGPTGDAVRDDALLADARTQLRAYLEGSRTAFELPLAPRGTPFQQAVWRALADTPYGTTCSYRDVAEAIGRPTATRAVGAANGRNPLPIVVPCHRVIGTSGALTGYRGGLRLKRFLLELEAGGVLPL